MINDAKSRQIVLKFTFKQVQLADFIASKRVQALQSFFHASAVSFGLFGVAPISDSSNRHPSGDICLSLLCLLEDRSFLAEMFINRRFYDSLPFLVHSELLHVFRSELYLLLRIPNELVVVVEDGIFDRKTELCGLAEFLFQDLVVGIDDP